MNKTIVPIFENPVKYWDKYPELYDGIFSIKQEVLDKEVNKETLCDNSYAFKKYNWTNKVSIEEGLKRVVDYVTKVLK